MFVDQLRRSRTCLPAMPGTLPLQVDPLLYKLPPADQAEFMNLVSMFAFGEDRNKRNMGMTTFIKHLSLIHGFVCKRDAFDALRGIICGVQFGSGSFLVNTARLKEVMFRSKSCMNGCFQKLGYNVCRPSHDIATIFAQILPGYGNHMCTSRQWCVRKASEIATLRLTPNISVEIVGSDSPPSSPPEKEEKEEKREPVFMYDIQSLLNIKAPVDGIHRMSCDTLPPLRH